MDIFALAFLPEFDWNGYKRLVKELSFSTYHELFLSLLAGTRRIPELGINDQKMARFRKGIVRKL
jgi:hypothetical protein